MTDISGQRPEEIMILKKGYHAITTTTAPSRDRSRYGTVKAVSVVSLISSSME
jgi:hypothetical protein